MDRTCRKCGKSKALEEFHKSPNNKGGRKNTCKSCVKDYHRDHYNKNRERERAKYKDRYNENKETYSTRARRYKLKFNYGLTVAQYDDMVVKQDGLCLICGSAPTGKYSRLVVDHDHKTGEVRGLLCHECNKGLGIFHDDVALLSSAIRYLRREG